MPSKNIDWTEVTKDKIWPLSYESRHGDLLYVKDHRAGEQTELSEEYWEQGRYTVHLRPGYAPETTTWERTYSEAFDDLDEAAAFVDGLLSSL